MDLLKNLNWLRQVRRPLKKEVKKLWAHAAVTGLYGKAIAKKIGQDSDTAFLCGLLHSIGKPFVVHTVNESKRQSETSVPWAVMEKVIKKSYVELGRKLSDVWQLPNPVKESIVLHEDCAYHLGTCPQKGAIITNLAIHLTSLLLDNTTNETNAIRELPVVRDLNVSEEDFDTLLEMQDSIRTSIEPMLT